MHLLVYKKIWHPLPYKGPSWFYYVSKLDNKWKVKGHPFIASHHSHAHSDAVTLKNFQQNRHRFGRFICDFGTCFVTTGHKNPRWQKFIINHPKLNIFFHHISPRTDIHDKIGIQ
jgi:hypothetical protein